MLCLVSGKQLHFLMFVCLFVFLLQCPVLYLTVTTTYLGFICLYISKVGWDILCQIAIHKREHWKKPCLSKWHRLFKTPLVFQETLMWEISIAESCCFHLNVLLGPSYFCRILDWPQKTLSVRSETESWPYYLVYGWCKSPCVHAPLISGRQLPLSVSLQLLFCSCLLGCPGQFAVILFD